MSAGLIQPRIRQGVEGELLCRYSMNIVLVIFDSLRQDHLGAYGSDVVFTPRLDAFARESVRFTNAYPESLPTLPFRRAMHTGPESSALSPFTCDYNCV